MKCVLFSRPEHDVTLSYLYYYSKQLVNLSKSLNHKTINKERENSTKENVIKVINRQKPNLMVFNGHGSPEVICGHKDEILVSSKENPEILKNAITYALSCSSALILGEIAVKKGAKCFIGYDFDFALGKDPDSEASPRKDKIAKLFLEPSNLLVDSLLKGKTVQESIDKSKKKMEENIWYLNTTESFPEASDYAPFLFGNYIGLTAKGNDNTKI